ncbi:hypothetical protein [Duganella levis]|uniref:Uncharacterized protein n=1 Tax=Duganella levis TaxID=2692169 RepID=A0ABW9W5Q0_9BURK|nr:hypothetical protein [Duganella levis]MYN29377.1 hypothetical protein [Duganella levis]
MEEMKTININVVSGSLDAAGVVIAPLNLDMTRVALEEAGIVFNENSKDGGWTSISAIVSMAGQSFGMNIEFKGKKLFSIDLRWRDGAAEKKGYDASEKDLIADKNSLSRLIEKKIAKFSPQEPSYNADVFNYDWGFISASASIRSSIVVMGLMYIDSKAMS